METAFVVGSLAWNTGLVAIAGVMIKKWMDKQELDTSQNRTDVKVVADRVATELKTTIADHKREIYEHNKEINDNLSGIYEQLRIANGRTAKLEGGLIKIEAVCAERHGGNGR